MKNGFDVNALPQWLEDVAAELTALNDYGVSARACGMAKGSFANICSEGAGPRGAIIIGRKKLFPKRELLKWMFERAAANGVDA